MCMLEGLFFLGSFRMDIKIKLAQHSRNRVKIASRQLLSNMEFLGGKGQETIPGRKSFGLEDIT